MVEKIKNKFITSQEFLPLKISHIDNFPTSKESTITTPKVKNSINQFLKSPSEINTSAGLGKKLFSEKATKSINQKVHSPEILDTKSISKIIPSEIQSKADIVKSELNIKNSMLRSQISEKGTKSHREAKVIFKKFRNSNTLNKSTGTNISKKIQNIEIPHIQNEMKNENDKKKENSEKLLSPSNLDFIEKSKIQNQKILKFTSKANDKKSSIKDSPISKSKKIFKHSKYNSGKKSQQEQLQNVYNSIGKIKEFVKQNSTIEIKLEEKEASNKNVGKRKIKKEVPSKDELGRRGELMQKIRTMAKKIKKSRQEKRESFKLIDITREMDYIIDQIDQIKGPSKNISRRRKRMRKGALGFQNQKNKTAPLSHFSRFKKPESKTHTSQIVSSTLKNPKKTNLMYSKLAQERKTRKLNKFKKMVNRSLYKSKNQKDDQLNEDTNPLKLTGELDDIFQTISGLEKQDLGNSYHRNRQKKLKTLMRSSKLDNIRRTMNMEREDSEKWLKSQSDLKSNEHLDKNFTMKKCPKCHMYFPLEKIARHCKKCKG